MKVQQLDNLIVLKMFLVCNYKLYPKFLFYPNLLIFLSFPPNSQGKVHIFLHNCYTLSMNSTQIGVFEEPD